MRKIIYFGFLFLTIFFVNGIVVEAGCGPRGCTEPLTDKDVSWCSSVNTCNCESGPYGKCPAIDPEIVSSKKYEDNIEKKEITVYDVGFIAAWTNSGGSWVTPTGKGGYFQAGGDFYNIEVNFNINLSSFTNAKNVKLKTIQKMSTDEIADRTNDVIRRFSSTNYGIANGVWSLTKLSDYVYNVKFTLSSVSLRTQSGIYGQNSKLPWQNDVVQGYLYYIPTKVVLTYEPILTCDINNKDHFGVAVNEQPGTGPGGVNCCNYFVELYKNNPTELEKLYNKYPQCKICPPGGCNGGGGTTPPPENQCFYSINVTCPGNNCSSNNKGTIKDMENWDCIFKSREQKDTNIKEHYSTEVNKDTNPYCSIFCREEIEYYFPQNTMTVLAGTHFTVGTQYGLNVWEPLTFKGTSTCRTDKIDYKKFEDDWVKADGDVSNRWDEWQIALKQKDAIDNYTSISGSSYSCDCVNKTNGVDCCTATVDVTESDRECTVTIKCRSILGFPICLPKITCKTVKSTVTKCAPGATDNTKYDYNKPETVYYNGKDVTPGGWCAGGSNSTKPNPNTSESYYTSALNTRESLLNSLNQCNSDWRYDYNTFNPDVTVSYDEPKYGTTAKLNSNVKTLSSQRRYYVGSINNATTTSKTALISRSICETRGIVCTSKKDLEYPINDGMIYVISKEATFSLPSNTYRYINKITGISSNAIPGENYIDVGYGNFPVHFSTETGKYNISLSYNGFGAYGTKQNKFNKFVFGKPSGTLMNVTRTCSKNYSCTYNVENKIQDYEKPPEGGENPQGLDVIFRQIDLKNPFPGLAGIGRLPGENWNDSSLIKDIITNNRGVEGDNIYFNNDVEPMYTITLDVILINKIRDYNRKVANGYADFNLTCQKGTGKNCKSNFIRENPDFKDHFTLANCVKTNVTGCVGRGR